MDNDQRIVFCLLATDSHLRHYDIRRYGWDLLPHCSECDGFDTSFQGIPVVWWYMIVAVPCCLHRISTWVMTLAVVGYGTQLIINLFRSGYVVGAPGSETPEWSWGWFPQWWTWMLGVVCVSIVLDVIQRLGWIYSDRMTAKRKWPVDGYPYIRSSWSSQQLA